MASLLDKSLDEIIKSKPTVRRKKVVSGVRKTKAAAVKKSAAATKKTPTGSSGTGNKKTGAKKSKNGAAAGAANPVLSSLGEAGLLATKVIVSNLPTDIDHIAVKQFFNSTLGSVSRCDGIFNSQGKPTGTFHVTFSKAGVAAKAVQRYNGTSIDNGKKIMKLDLVLEPTKKSLAARISAPAANAEANAGGASTGKNKKKKAKKAAAVNAGTAKIDASGKTKQKKKKVARKPKKTLEELDAEMTDYMNGK